MASTFWVQVGAFRDRDNVMRLVGQLTDKRYSATISPSRSATTSLVVRVGPYPDRSAAEVARAALHREGFSGFVMTDSSR